MIESTTNRPPRILHATECAAMGTLQVILALTRELHAVGAEHRILYCERAGETPHDLPALFPSGIEFIQVAAATGSHLRFLQEFPQALRRCVREWQPDVVHLHSSKAGFVGRFALAARSDKTTVLYSPHGLSFLDPARPVSNKLFKALERAAARTGARSVACGASEAKLLTELTGQHGLLLENPVDEEFLSIERQASMAPIVVTVGRLSRQKAPDSFAAVARQVRSHRPDARFIWIGDGDPEYKAALLDAGCEVTGWVTKDQIIALLATATMYIQTSKWEGMSIAVIQAMAAGIACVVNDCVGNRDAITHELTGLISTSDTAMAGYVLRLLDDPACRERMGLEARAVALRRFGRRAFGRRVMEVYGIADLRSAADLASADISDQATAAA